MPSFGAGSSADVLIECADYVEIGQKIGINRTLGILGNMASRMRLAAGGVLAALALMTAPVIASADPEPEPDPAPVFEDPGPPPPSVDPWMEQYGRDVGAGAAGGAAEAGAGILLSPFLGPFTGLATAPIGGAIDSSIRDAP